MTILDTIDHAIEDWTMSSDAMRWAPDAPKVQPVSGDTARPFRVSVRADFGGFSRAARSLGEALAQLGVGLKPLLHHREDRIRRMRAAYRGRKGKRW